MTYHNTRYIIHQSFELLESSLKVHRKGLFDEIEYEVPYDSIHNKKTIQTEINNNLLVSGFFCVVISFLFLLGSAQQMTWILFILGSIMVILSFINRKKTITIPTYTGENIILYFNKRNKADVVEYSERIIEASNNYILKKYTKIDNALPIEPQLERLQFLLNREVLSENDFETLKNNLLGRNDKSSIGFGR